MKYLGNLLIAPVLLLNILFVLLVLLVAYSPYVQPVEHPVWSCVGLTFPVFLLINVGFLVFWLILQRYKSALVPLIGLLLCSGQIRTYFPINFQTDELPADGIKVLSYNIMGFAGCLKEKGENPILNYLKESGADIICLQEYGVHHSAKYLTQKDVDRALKAYPYHYISRTGQKTQLACYSKYPILSVHPIKYVSDRNQSYTYELQVDKDTLLLINNHLESNKLTKADKIVYEEMIASPEQQKVKSGVRQLVKKLAEASAIRAPQADSVARVVEKSRHRYIVVCGDFNDTPISYAHRVIGQELKDAFVSAGCGPGISYNQNKFYFRIDHILTGKNLQAYNCMVDRSIKTSDHYPISCYLVKRE